MKAVESLRRLRRATARSVGVFIRDVGHGMLEISHNTLALLGLVVLAVVVFGAGQAEVRQQAEAAALQWLQSRHDERTLRSGDVLASVAEPDAVARATATDPSTLTRQQAAVALWLARRYKVAAEPVSRLVQEAWGIGQRAAIEPTLILAIMAVESSFNPFAQSAVGAQGLMQVMTRVHDEKFEVFGGSHAVFDPISNLRVGVQVLKECIARAGSLQEGLRFYVGAANLDGDGGYVAKVLSEQGYLRNVADGKSVPVNAPMMLPPPKEAPPVETPSPAPSSEQVALLR